MEDGETLERKNRNLVRKKVAGGEMLAGGTSITPETCTSFWGAGQTAGRSSQGQALEHTQFWKAQMLPGHLGHHMATNTGSG